MGEEDHPVRGRRRREEGTTHTMAHVDSELQDAIKKLLIS